MEKCKALQQYLSFEVLSHTIGHDTVRVANALNLSEGYVRKFKQPPPTEDNPDYSGERNPLDRLEIIIQSVELIDESRAYKPIVWLCARFGFLPPVKAPSVEIVEPEEGDIVKSLLTWNREFGETSAIVEKVFMKGSEERKELCKEIFRELFEDYQAGLTLLSQLEKIGR